MREETAGAGRRITSIVWRAAAISAVAALSLGCGSEEEGAIPEQVVKSAGGSVGGALAIDGSELIFTRKNVVATLVSASLAGTDEREIAAIDENATPHVAVGGDFVFAGGANVLFRVPRAGGVPVQIGAYNEASKVPMNLVDVAADAKGAWAAVYPTSAGFGMEGRVNAYENEPMGPVVIEAEEVSAVALDETHVYWTTSDSVRRRPRAAAASGPEEIIAEDQGRPMALKVTKTHVIWLNLGSVEVMVAAKDGGAPKAIVKRGPACEINTLPAIEADETSVYFAMGWPPPEDQKPGDCPGFMTILKAPIAGGAIVPLSLGRETGNPSQLAVSEDHVYYTDFGDLAIKRVPK